ncbi:MAG: YdcF family protein, partial [Thermanaerothrix sp.]|nr:YdcF family protein [Thermanaerothrix sp.]
MKTLKKLFTLSAVVGSGAIFLLGISNLTAWLYAKPRTFTLQDSPTAPVAIVFGAGLSRDGSPSPVLRDRVATAAQLYFEGKVSKLLMSGDNRFINYNEPGAMRDYALQLGVPDTDIVLDYAG